MNVYAAAQIAEAHFSNSFNRETTVQTNAILGVNNGQVLKFKDESDAIRLNAGAGYLFKMTFRNGVITTEPIEG